MGALDRAGRTISRQHTGLRVYKSNRVRSRCEASPATDLGVRGLGAHIIPFVALIPLVLAAKEVPSFPCDKANLPDEKLVCANPALAALHRQVAVAYSWAVEVTRTPAQVLAEQRAWIAKRRVCVRERADEAHSKACLEDKYRGRLRDLEALLPLGHPDAVLVMHHQRHTATVKCLSLDISWQELGSTDLPGATPFNEFFKEQPREPCPGPVKGWASPGDESVWTRFAWVSSRLLSVGKAGSTYGSGAAHPLSNSTAQTLILDRDGPFIAGDDFIVKTRRPAVVWLSSSRTV